MPPRRRPPVVAPSPVTDDAVTPVAFGDLSWLDTKHAIYDEHEAAWRREERRLLGGDAVLSDLVQFDGESDPSFDGRKKAASYVNFPRAHTIAITGALSASRPMPGKGLSYGLLGDVRARDAIQDNRPSYAEIVHYNVDGVGADGSEFAAWFDGVDERAQATGHRWLMVEAPGELAGKAPTMQQVLDGARPYAVEFSPLAVWNWYFRRGQLQFAVVRVPTDEPTIANGRFTEATDDGYYLLVRKGFRGLGDVFALGGWWLFDHAKQFTGRTGTWDATRGDIPLWVHYGERDPGTADHPAMSRSSTMELGQIAVGLMNLTSARDFDFWDACASRLYFLGATPKIMKQVAAQHAKRSVLIGVPHDTGPQGELRPVAVYDGSAGAVTATVSELIITAKYTEAREQSFQQITATPESSGASKAAGFAELKAPYLARRARLRQQSEQTLIYFFECRFALGGSPRGYSVWPTDFDLAPLADAIDLAYDTLRTSKLRSKTLEVGMVLTAMEERGLVNDENRGVVEAELNAAFDAAEAQAEAAAEAFRALGVGDGTEDEDEATGATGMNGARRQRRGRMPGRGGEGEREARRADEGAAST